MRYTPEHKERTRERILSAAGELFRREGFAGASVDRVMRAAGLTVGGFYAHFDSKQDLFIETLRRTLAQRRRRWLEGLEDLRGDEFLRHFVRRYLSRIHRDSVEEGCPLPSVLSEIARGEPELRRALAEEIEKLLDEVVPRLDGPGARQRALGALGTCFGALALSRATAGTPLSDECLLAAREVFGAGPTSRRPA